MGRWLPRGLALAGAVWCLGVGVWIWIAPIRGEGVGSSAYTDSSGVVQTTAYRFSTTASFADHSLLGPVPLLIPFMIAGVGVWGAWRGRWLPLAIATAIMLVFVFLTGFSIGSGYVPAVAALMWALIAQLDAKGT